MEIKFVKLEPEAVMPTYATDGSACVDLVAVKEVQLGFECYKQHKQRKRRFHTGIACEIRPGYALLVFSRSGHGFSRNIRLSNCVGVIDSDYRGEIMVDMWIDGAYWDIELPARVAQAMVIPVPRTHWVQVDDLSDTARGAGGFGSTGT